MPQTQPHVAAILLSDIRVQAEAAAKALAEIQMVVFQGTGENSLRPVKQRLLS